LLPCLPRTATRLVNGRTRSRRYGWKSRRKARRGLRPSRRNDATNQTDPASRARIPGRPCLSQRPGRRRNPEGQFTRLLAGGLVQRQVLKRDKLVAFAALDHQGGATIAAGEVERTAFLAVEPRGFSWIENEADPRRRAPGRRIRIRLLIDHQIDDAARRLLHEIAA